ncbi:MAG: AMP-binding protein, partial [bacterium]|nr:AMP-binding protein [bacterium]
MLINHRVAIFGETSEKYLQALLYLWHKGFVAVLCPMRDPVIQLDAWLNSINCHEVIVLDSENKPFDSSHAKLHDWHIYSADKSHFTFANRKSGAGTIICTSGSSGKAKSVWHDLEQHIANAKAVIKELKVDIESRWLLSLPLYHVSGLSIAIRCWVADATIIVPHLKWSFSWALNTAGVTHVSLVTTQLQKALNDEIEKDCLKKIQAIVLGGGPASLKLLQVAVENSLPVWMTYGMSEMASQITLAPLNSVNLLSSGNLLNGRSLKITDDGEICVKGKMLFNGYVESDRLITAIDHDGWFHTGDLGFLDENNNLQVKGRKDNCFISGGENVYPEEIEAAILRHEDVVEVIVVSMFDIQ